MILTQMLLVGILMIMVNGSLQTYSFAEFQAESFHDNCVEFDGKYIDDPISCDYGNNQIVYFKEFT